MRAVARICPRWLSSQRDDLVQPAIMRVMQIVNQRAALGEGDAPFTSSYLYKVAYSALIDEMRRMTRRRETGLEDENVTEVPGTAADPERSAASQEIGQGIQSPARNARRRDAEGTRGLKAKPPGRRRASAASEPRDRSEPTKRRARARVGESEGRRPSDEIRGTARAPSADARRIGRRIRTDGALARVTQACDQGSPVPARGPLRAHAGAP